MKRALAVVAALAGTAHADREYARGALRVAVETTGEVALPLARPERSSFRTDTARAAGALVVEGKLCGTPWRFGGVARVTTEPSIAIGASAAYELGVGRTLRAELGTFTCPACRGAVDPRAFFRGEIDLGDVMLSAEARAVMFDVGAGARPIGTRTELYFGAGVHNWRGALVLVAVETALYAYVATRPHHEND